MAAFATLLFSALPQCFKTKWIKRSLQHISLIPMAGSWFAFIGSFIPLESFSSISVFATFVILPLAAIVAFLSRFTPSSGRSFRFLAGAIAVFAAVYQLATFPGVISAMIGLSVSIIVTFLSFSIREKGLLYSGIIGAIFSLAYHVRYAVEFYQSNLWLSLAATGITVILSASAIGRVS